MSRCSPTAPQRAAVLDRRPTPGSTARSWSTRSASCRSATGCNAATLNYGDLVADGVIDPVKVTRSAVLNAASVARMVLTTETAIVEKPAEEDDDHGHGHHGHAH